MAGSWRVDPHGAACLLLEDALIAHVARTVGGRVDAQRLNALVARLGLRGQPPVTLTAAGELAGLSGERIRQLELRLRRHHRKHLPTPPPQLDAALQAVGGAAPVGAGAVPGLLQRLRLSAGPFSLESLLSAAELFDRRLPFAVCGCGAGAVALPSAAGPAVANASQILALARRQTERCGADRLRDLAAELSVQGVAVTVPGLRMLLKACTQAEVRSDGWYWFRDAGERGGFLTATRRMLAVTSPLPVTSLHDGLRRQLAYRRRLLPPPTRVLAQVYADHPWFKECSGMVSSVTPVCPEVLGANTLRILEILRTAPGHMLSRSELLDACHRAGLNLPTVALYLTYSECLQRVRPGVFAPRGTVAAASGPWPQSPRRTAASTLKTVANRDGRVELALGTTVNTWANGVIHLSRMLRTALAGRRFECTDERGEPVTTIAVDHHGNSWGWVAFLRRSGGGPGDVVLATLDPQAGTGVLRLRAGEPTDSR